MNEQVKEEKNKNNKKTIFIIGGIVLIAVLALVIPKIINKGADSEDEKINTGSEYGDKYANYLNEKILTDTDKAKAALINFDDKDDPEMLINYEENEEEYTIVLYIESDEVKETSKQKNVKPKILYSVKTEAPNWYFETKEENKDTTYVPVTSILTNENTTDKTITKDENFEKEYIEVDMELEEKEINKENIKDLNGLVNDYKKNDNSLTEEKQQEIKTKLEEIKKAEKLEAAKITSSNYNEKIGNHLKYFVGIYRGAYYGWPEVFDYKDVTNSVKVPGQTEYSMVYEVVGLKSLNDLQAKLEEYILKSKIPTNHPITREFTEYNGKVYLVMGGIGSGDFFDLKKTQILSSENGITKVKIFEYEGLGPKVVVEEVTLTITYNSEKDSYQITDYSSKKMN